MAEQDGCADGWEGLWGSERSLESICDDSLSQSVWSHIKFDFQEMYSNTAWGCLITSLQLEELALLWLFFINTQHVVTEEIMFCFLYSS